MKNDTQAQTTTLDTEIKIEHIDGPLKGKVFHFRQGHVTIGRDPTNDIVYPSDLVSISRHHAELIWDEGEYLFISLGKNSCLMNQTALDRSYVKNGDIIWLTQRGPKIRIEIMTSEVLSDCDLSMSIGESNFARYGEHSQATDFTFQFENSTKSICKNTIRLGSGKDMDIAINSPFIAPLHCEIIFREDAFFIRDKSGNGATYVNDEKATPELLLQKNDVIKLGNHGAEFQFLGTGQFIEKVGNEQELDTTIFVPYTHQQNDNDTGLTIQQHPTHNKGVNFLKSIFSRIWP